MALNEKIKRLLAAIDITPSIFADEIGVQRSSISHILAGRNRPSLDIVQKIVRRYPELGVEWILDDDFALDEQLLTKHSKSAETVPNSPSTKPYQTSLDLAESIRSGARTDEPNLKASVSDQKSIERILVFFSDGTFKEYMAQ